MPCINFRVLVMLSSFLLMRVSALQPAALARAKDSAQGSPLRKEEFFTSRPHSYTSNSNAISIAFITICMPADVVLARHIGGDSHDNSRNDDKERRSGQPA